MHTNKTTNKRKSVKKSLKKRYKTIIRENNLTTLYTLSFLLAVLFVFPIIINYLMLLTSLVVVSGIGLVGYVVVNRSIDHRNRPLQQRLLEALPDKGIKYAATAKFLAGGYERQWEVVSEPKQIEADVVVDVVSSVKQLSLLEALKQSTVDSWMLGQNDTSYCQINIYDLVHLGLIGATGTGKSSSTALLIMLHALKNGFHVIALDAKSVDWTRYNTHIEAYATDYTTFPNQVDQLCALHDNRMLAVKNAGVSNIDELPSKLNHILVILEEFGYLCQSLKSSDKQQYEQTISKLSNLMRVSRSSGINILIVDQKPNGWPNAVTANVKGFICYKLKGQLGNAIGEYHLDKLAAKGEFSYEGEAFKAWFTKAEIGDLLKRLPKRNDSLLEECSEAALLKDVQIVPCTVDAKDVDKDNGGIAAISTIQSRTVQSVQLPKVITSRLELVNKLIELMNNSQTVNDSICRKLHQEMYGKSINGSSSKQIVEYVQSQTN